MSKEIPMFVNAKDDGIKASLLANKHYLERFCNPSELTIDTGMTPPEKAMSAVLSGAEVYLPLEGLINKEEELNRLQKEWEKWNKEVELVQKKLSNEKFVNNAPEQIVAKEREKEKDYLEKRAKVEE